MYTFEALAQELGTKWRADLTWLAMKLPDGAVPPQGGSQFIQELEAYLNTHSLPFWEGGNGLPGTTPPGGWPALTLEGLVNYTERSGVLDEVARRANTQPGQVWVLESARPIRLPGGARYFIVGSTSHGVVGVGKEIGNMYGTEATGATLRVFHATPHPDGWWTGYRLAGPEHYAALQLVKEQSGGGLDVSRVIHLWSRDEFTGRGRFLAYYKDADIDGTLFVHSTFWSVLDAMALLDDIGILPATARLSGRVVRLNDQTTILPLLSTEDSTTQTLVYVFRQGPTYGSNLDQVVPAPRPGGPAFVYHHDFWLPTHQEWSAVLVALAEGEVLPLKDGRGITLKDGVPYLVPGLARSPEHHVWARARAL